MKMLSLIDLDDRPILVNIDHIVCITSPTGKHSLLTMAGDGDHDIACKNHVHDVMEAISKLATPMGGHFIKVEVRK